MAGTFEIVQATFAIGLVLFSGLWGFRYGSLTGDNCWVVKPYYSSEYVRNKGGHRYTGMPGSGRYVAQEEDHLFRLQYVLYAVAVACSAVGLMLAFRLWVRKHSRESYSDGKYRLYTTGLCFYFFTALAVNSVTSITFTEYRCHYHNIMSEDGVHVATLGAEWSKSLFMTGNFWGGFFRNLVMEFVLLFKASMMQSDPGFDRWIRVLRVVILVQIVFFVPFLPIEFLMWKGMMRGGFEAVFGDDETLVHIGRAAALVFGVVHVLSSTALVYIFVRPLLWPDPLDAVGMKMKFGVVSRVVFLAVVAVSSTFVCYINIGAGFANSYLILVGDSIINDFCMVLVSFIAPEEDVQLSQEATHGDGVKAMAIGQMSDDTELSGLTAPGTFVPVTFEDDDDGNI